MRIIDKNRERPSAALLLPEIFLQALYFFRTALPVCRWVMIQIKFFREIIDELVNIVRRIIKENRQDIRGEGVNYPAQKECFTRPGLTRYHNEAGMIAEAFFYAIGCLYLAAASIERRRANTGSQVRSCLDHQS